MVQGERAFKECDLMPRNSYLFCLVYVAVCSVTVEDHEDSNCNDDLLLSSRLLSPGMRQGVEDKAHSSCECRHAN